VPLLLLLALVYGVGYSAIHPTTIAVADDVSTNATRGMALGLVGGMFSIGVGAGAASMGYVLQRTSYETMFLTASLIPLVAGVVFVWCWQRWQRPAATAFPSFGGAGEPPAPVHHPPAARYEPPTRDEGAAALGSRPSHPGDR
jgi:MFS family permease